MPFDWPRMLAQEDTGWFDLIWIGIVIGGAILAAIGRASAEKKKQQEQQRQQEQRASQSQRQAGPTQPAAPQPQRSRTSLAESAMRPTPPPAPLGAARRPATPPPPPPGMTRPAPAAPMPQVSPLTSLAGATGAHPSEPRRLSFHLDDPQAARDAIVLMEILGPPKALRQDDGPPGLL